VLPNIFKGNKVSISERVTFPLRLSFAVCRISRVVLISELLNEDFGVDFGLCSVG